MTNEQMTFTDYEYSLRKRGTRREEFLRKMEEIIPWAAWVQMIQPYVHTIAGTAANVHDSVGKMNACRKSNKTYTGID
ncbi:MAG: hypothetical protein Q4D38_00660 [Planctomycetia bacterium]|nr:hypothetical protein [Planctomycetia bacterium]